MKIFLLALLISAIIEAAQSQSISKNVVAPAGDTHSNPGEDIVLSYTVGQTATGTYFAGDNAFSLSQGFHTGMPLDGLSTQELMARPDATIYPNPTEKNIFLELTKDLYGITCFNVYNNQGELITSQKVDIHHTTHKIETDALNSGLYLIVATFQGGAQQQFKIIKQ